MGHEREVARSRSDDMDEGSVTAHHKHGGDGWVLQARRLVIFTPHRDVGGAEFGEGKKGV